MSKLKVGKKVILQDKKTTGRVLEVHDHKQTVVVDTGEEIIEVVQSAVRVFTFLKSIWYLIRSLF